MNVGPNLPGFDHADQSPRDLVLGCDEGVLSAVPPYCQNFRASQFGVAVAFADRVFVQARAVVHVVQPSAPGKITLAVAPLVAVTVANLLSWLPVSVESFRNEAVNIVARFHARLRELDGVIPFRANVLSDNLPANKANAALRVGRFPVQRTHAAGATDLIQALITRDWEPLFHRARKLTHEARLNKPWSVYP